MIYRVMHFMLLLALGLAGACPRTGPPRPPAGRRAAAPVDCARFCNRLTRCFEAFLSTADPHAAPKLAKLQKEGLLEKMRQTTIRVCRSECGRAGYRDTAAQVINQCLAQPTCARFGPCAMNRIYRVDCYRMCHRVYIDCLREMLRTRLGPEETAALRRAGQFQIVGAAGYAGCVSECRRHDGMRANALGVNICLRRPACNAFSQCMRGFIQIPDPRVPSCDLLFLRYKHCNRLPLGHTSFLRMCRRLSERPHLQAELRCALVPGCVRFKACIKRVPHPKRRQPPTK